mmetsp:Transcript_12415/g.35282  ORF Transcript_12415/g.35282 Transcript_12415/m.35282 type:complete len:610 (-) Transcript_12415:98-1927(-)
MAISDDESVTLREFLNTAEPSWKEKDLDAVVKKLAKVGINDLNEILLLLRDTCEEDCAQTAPSEEHRINQLLRSAGERRFASGTLGKLRALAASFTAAGEVRVSLRNLAGELVELDFAPHCRGLDLKARAAELWQVPVICQKAVVGNIVLGDSELLVAHFPPGAPALSVTMLVSLDSIAKDLEDGAGPIRKVAALSILAQLPTTGRQHALDTVTAHLDDSNEIVRRAALHALSRLMPRGDGATVARLVHSFTEDPDLSVRQSAAEALGEAASKGDETIQEVLKACMTGNEEASTRAAAARALARVSREEDQHVIEVLCGLLEDEDAEVRSSALRELPRVAPRGGAGAAAAVAAVAARLPHREAASSGPSAGGQQLAERCAVRRRRCVVQALGVLAEAGDEQTLAALHACLDDADAGVRCAAMEAVCNLAGPEDSRVAAAAHTLLEDPRESIRLAGLVALRRRAAVLAEDARGSPAHTVLAVSKLLQDPSDSVRKAAVDTLSVTAEEGNVLAVTQAAACTEHPLHGVRLRAAEALVTVAQKGDECAIGALLDLLRDPKDGIRLFAVEGLRMLVEGGDERVSAAAYDCCLEDASASVRSAAWALCERLERG